MVILMFKNIVFFKKNLLNDKPNNKNNKVFDLSEKKIGNENIFQLKEISSDDIINIYKEYVKKNELKESPIIFYSFLSGFFDCAKKYIYMYHDLISAYNYKYDHQDALNGKILELDILNELSPIKSSLNDKLNFFNDKITITKKELFLLNFIFEYNENNKKIDSLKGFFKNIIQKNSLNTNFNYTDNKFYSKNFENVFQGFIKGYESAENHLIYLFSLLKKNRLNNTIINSNRFFLSYYHLTNSLYLESKKKYYLTNYLSNIYFNSYLKRFTLNKENMYKHEALVFLFYQAL